MTFHPRVLWFICSKLIRILECRTIPIALRWMKESRGSTIDCTFDFYASETGLRVASMGWYETSNLFCWRVLNINASYLLATITATSHDAKTSPLLISFFRFFISSFPSHTLKCSTAGEEATIEAVSLNVHTTISGLDDAIKEWSVELTAPVRPFETYEKFRGNDRRSAPLALHSPHSHALSHTDSKTEMGLGLTGLFWVIDQDLTNDIWPSSGLTHPTPPHPLSQRLSPIFFFVHPLGSLLALAQSLSLYLTCSASIHFHSFSSIYVYMDEVWPHNSMYCFWTDSFPSPPHVVACSVLGHSPLNNAHKTTVNFFGKPHTTRTHTTPTPKRKF